MRFPLHVATDMIGWQVRNWWAGNKRVPVVLMLEPLHTCNLACLGCSPERYTGDLKDRLSVAQCFQAADECGAPVVSVCGGEPTVYPEIVELIDGLIARKKHVIMCTNAILLDRFYRKAQPRALPALPEDLLDAALPPVRRRAARLPLHAVGESHLHAEGMEGALLPHRGAVLRLVEGLLRRGRLGLLGEPQGSPLPQLQDALGIRAVGG